MINFNDYNREELLNLKDELTSYLRGQEPEPPSIHIRNFIKIEDSVYVDKDELIPKVEFKITTNKEAIQDHINLWSNYFNEYNNFLGYKETNVSLEVEFQIKNAFLTTFEDYLSKKLEEL